MADLASLTTPSAVGDGPLRWDVPDGWQQGRGAWGGLVVAALARAALRTEPDGARRLRSLSAQLVAPVPAGPAAVDASVLRRGSGATTIAVRLTGPDRGPETLAHAVAVLGAGRADDVATDTWPAVVAPVAPAWAEVPVAPLGPPVAPVFLQHLEIRPVHGIPLARDHDETLGWLRLLPADRPPAYDDALLAALADTWWPTLLSHLPMPRPVATLSFDVTLTADATALDPAVPLLHHGRIVRARDGYVVEQRQLWSADGALLAHNVQTMAIIR